MDLDKNWRWEKKKLPCKIRNETCNPCGDDLRERFVELAGANLQDLIKQKDYLVDMQIDKKKRENKNKIAIEFSTQKRLNELLTRSHVMGAAELALEGIMKPKSLSGQSTKKNKNKVFCSIVTSPPRRIQIDSTRKSKDIKTTRCRGKELSCYDAGETIGEPACC